MSDKEDGQIRDDGDAREPYEPPSLECDELFETLALACGKIDPVAQNCRLVHKLS